MSGEQWAALIPQYLIPLLSFTAAVLVFVASRKGSRSTTEVASKEANTHEFSVLIGGFKDALETVQGQYEGLETRYAALEAKHEALEVKHGALEIKHSALESEVARKDSQTDELIQHILKLELLIPNPPGPPARPSWITS